MQVTKDYLKILLIADTIVDNSLSDYWCERYYEIEQYYNENKDSICSEPEFFYKNTLIKLDGIKKDCWKHLRLRSNFKDFIYDETITFRELDKWEKEIKVFCKDKNSTPAADWYIGKIDNLQLKTLELLCG